jgi:hypothetical protein
MLSPLHRHLRRAFTGWVGLTEEEIRRKFEEIDTDQSGTIDQSELEKALRDIGQSETEIQAMLARIPPGTSLEFCEFKDMLQVARKPTGKLKDKTVKSIEADIALQEARSQSTRFCFLDAIMERFLRPGMSADAIRQTAIIVRILLILPVFALVGIAISAPRMGLSGRTPEGDVRVQHLPRWELMWYCVACALRPWRWHTASA